MKTAMLLMARYDALPVIPVERVCEDYFQHLSADKFIRKVDAGEIDIPLVRIEGSSKCARGVPLIDLANYIDARASEARAVNDKIHGRKVVTLGGRAA